MSPRAATARSPAPAPAGVSDGEFARFQALVHREAGIWLSPAKKALLCGRLARRVRELGLGTLGSYAEVVERDLAERVHMLDCITTNETHFFREPRHFEILDQHLFPAWRAEGEAGRRPRRVRLWSAACSTGEEPYSLAMALLRAFPPGSGWELEVLATDLSTRVLERARQATWPIAKQSEIPLADLRAFMLRGTGSQEGRMKAGPELRELVRFSRLNLNDAIYPVAGSFDAIFCRNVLIYFDAPTKAAVVERLRGHLSPGGYLFLGHAESLGGRGTGLVPVFPTVYARAPGGGS
ncbi:MAG: protein-glutamate O-methyltransferase CheR [Deltaproteobacteria bacterium]|nr:protein-glutamate O-methyltransferase CheR [Deltaproteobacteria bacterium]